MFHFMYFSNSLAGCLSLTHLIRIYSSLESTQVKSSSFEMCYVISFFNRTVRLLCNANRTSGYKCHKSLFNLYIIEKNMSL